MGSKAMRIERHYTQPGVSPYDLIAFATTKSEIRNPDGSVVFSLQGVEVPAAWSQVAADVLAQKYFRKAGIPARVKRVEEESVPSFLWRSVPDETALSSLPKDERMGSETSAKQVFDRLAGAWAYWGWKAGYFDGEDDARAYYDEMRFMLARQMAAPNSPQWFNTGLHWAYGVDGPSQGHYYVDFETASSSSRSRPTSIRSRTPASSSRSPTISSTRAGSWTSGCARRACSNTAPAPARTSRLLRGENEKLSGGGRSSGLMSFLKIGDRAAGAIKSGGTTRRAAKMVVVDVDHPDIEAYIDWKVNEEQKVAALAAGSKVVKRHLKAIFRACVNCEGSGDDCFNDREEPGAQTRGQGRAQERGAGRHHQAHHPIRPPGLCEARIRRLTTPTGSRRPISPSPARTRTIRCACPTPSCRRSRTTASGISPAASTARSRRP